MRRLIRNRITSSSPEKTPGIFDEHSTKSRQGQFTLNTDKMSDSGIDQDFSDPQYSGHELHIRHENGKITFNTVEKGEENRLDLSDLELASNLTSST